MVKTNEIKGRKVFRRVYRLISEKNDFTGLPFKFKRGEEISRRGLDINDS